MPTPVITAPQIRDLIAQRHSEDIFVPECKDGPSQGCSHVRLDAWAMARSWSKPRMWGYEIKVSRADFLQDDKWPEYLKTCNMFYFVVPPGLIDKAELPEACGLIECSKNAKRLFTRVKAPRREIDFPESVIRYILHSRVEILAYDRYRREGGQTEFWKAWMQERDERADLGAAVSKRISRLVKERIAAVAQENRQLQRNVEAYQAVQKALDNIGLTIEELSSWNPESQIRRALQPVSPGMIPQLRRVADELEKLSAQCSMEKSA